MERKEDKKAPVSLTEAKIRKYLRWEETPARLLEQAAAGLLQIKKQYRPKAEDLLAVLDKGAQAPEGVLEEEWAGPMWELAPLLLAKEEEWEGYRGLPGESEQIRILFWNLLRAIAEGEADYDAFRKRLESLIAMREQEIPLRQYDDSVKEQYILYYEDPARLKDAAESELLLYILFVDELCRKRNPLALKAKAMALFGGNRAYPCNWEKARDMLRDLMEVDPSPLYPNLLGFLYINGRTTQGRPDFDKAFYYFSIGAAGGMEESRYMLAEMFKEGLGVPKNHPIAAGLLNQLYGETLSLLLREEYDQCFPEVAYRVACLHREGIGMEAGPQGALFFSLQARYALMRRQQIRSLEGDAPLADNIEEMMDRCAQEMMIGPTPSLLPVENPAQVLHSVPMDQQDHFEMKAKTDRKNRLHIYLTRCHYDGKAAIHPMLVTLPEYLYCGRQQKLHFILEDAKVSLKQAQGSEKAFSFHFDAIEGERFLLGKDCCAKIKGNWLFKIEAEDWE